MHTLTYLCMQISQIMVLQLGVFMINTKMNNSAILPRTLVQDRIVQLLGVEVSVAMLVSKKKMTIHFVIG